MEVARCTNSLHPVTTLVMQWRAFWDANDVFYTDFDSPSCTLLPELQRGKDTMIRHNSMLMPLSCSGTTERAKKNGPYGPGIRNWHSFLPQPWGKKYLNRAHPIACKMTASLKILFSLFLSGLDQSLAQKEYVGVLYCCVIYCGCHTKWSTVAVKQKVLLWSNSSQTCICRDSTSATSHRYHRQCWQIELSRVGWQKGSRRKPVNNQNKTGVLPTSKSVAGALLTSEVEMTERTTTETMILTKKYIAEMGLSLALS